MNKKAQDQRMRYNKRKALVKKQLRKNREIKRPVTGIAPKEYEIGLFRLLDGR